MQNDSVTIRNLAWNEMPLTDQLADIDKRNPGLNDGEFLFRADDKGFIAAILNNQIILALSDYTLLFPTSAGTVCMKNFYLLPSTQPEKEM